MRTDYEQFDEILKRSDALKVRKKSINVITMCSIGMAAVAALVIVLFGVIGFEHIVAGRAVGVGIHGSGILARLLFDREMVVGSIVFVDFDGNGLFLFGFHLLFVFFQFGSI